MLQGINTRKPKYLVPRCYKVLTQENQNIWCHVVPMNKLHTGKTTQWQKFDLKNESHQNGNLSGILIHMFVYQLALGAKTYGSGFNRFGVFCNKF